MKIIITGGCGFIGHHFVEHVFKNTDWEIIIFDKLSYASNGFERLRDTNTLNNSRVKVFTNDLTNPLPEGIIKEIGLNVDYIVHMAAETHVDRSISHGVPFIHTNINGIYSLLEAAKVNASIKILVVSTDEVYGSINTGEVD